MRKAGSYIDPFFLGRMGRLLGKSGPEVVDFTANFYDRHVNKSTVQVTPYYGNVVWEQTSEGRPYLKMPVQTFLEATGGLATDGLITYVVYKVGDRWHAIDLKPGVQYRMFRRAYPDFSGFKIFKYR